MTFLYFQIEFLNSVIIDLQKKNQELKDKLEKVAAAALNGNSPSEMDNYDRSELCSKPVDNEPLTALEKSEGISCNVHTVPLRRTRRTRTGRCSLFEMRPCRVQWCIGFQNKQNV